MIMLGIVFMGGKFDCDYQDNKPMGVYRLIILSDKLMKIILKNMGSYLWFVVRDCYFLYIQSE